MSKSEKTKFMIWLRNGSCFCVTWFLLLIVVGSSILHIESISTQTLAKMMVVTVGGVFLFCVCFTSGIIKKMQFVGRLTLFMLVYSGYECFGLYWIGVFGSKGSVVHWVIFILIILACYLSCILIYQGYSKKQGELYTEALQSYQKK